MNARWSKWVSKSELTKIQPYLNHIEALKLGRLTGVGIVGSFIRRRIQPLQQRERFGFEYIGADDSSRMIKKELSEDEVLTRVQRVLAKVRKQPALVAEF